MDSGYPTREVVKTASPEMFALAPKDFPEKIGPFCGDDELRLPRCLLRHAYLDREGSPLGRDLCGLSVRRWGGHLAFGVGLDGSQGTRLNAVLCYLSQDIDRPHSGRLEDLRQHIGVG
jgi:hypothetical protein